MERHMQAINNALKVLCSEEFLPYAEAVYF